MSFNPSTGTLSPGNSVTVTISSIPCQKGSFTFNGSGGASSVSVTWKCANWTQFGYDPQQTRFNPNEDVLSPSNVSGLVVDWKSSMSATSYTSPVVVNNLAYIGLSDGYLYALNASTGAVVWKDYVASPTSAAEANGIVYVGSLDHNYGFAGLWAMDAQTGAVLWHNGSDFFGPPTVTNGIVYTDGNSSIAAFDAASGAVKWAFPISGGGGNTNGAPAVVNGVVYASANKNVYAFDAGSGTLLWTYTANYYIYSTPAVGNDGVYVDVGNGVVIALNASTGATLWSVPGCGCLTNTSPAVFNGVVYSSVNDTLYAFNATNGTVLWQTTVSNSESSPAVANGVVYVGSGDGNVYAFDASSGTKL